VAEIRDGARCGEIATVVLQRHLEDDRAPVISDAAYHGEVKQA
jgi:hypothetical protein